MERGSIEKGNKADKTYTLAFVGISLWRCVPDGNDPFSKVRDELGSEFCEQFNLDDIKVFKGLH
jgi:hypothetical protein